MYGEWGSLGVLDRSISVFITKEGYLEVRSYRRAINPIMRKVCLFLIRGNTHIGRTKTVFSPDLEKRPRGKTAPRSGLEKIWHLWNDTQYYLQSESPIRSFAFHQRRRDESCIGHYSDKNSQYHSLPVTYQRDFWKELWSVLRFHQR